MTPENVQEAATYLLKATEEAREVDRVTSKFPEMTLQEAYRVQREGMKLRQKLGAKWVGWKMGLTSEAKRRQMSLGSAIFGYLHDRGAVSPAGPLHLKGLIHPKIEPEIGFRLRKDLKGKVSFDEALDAIESVCPALEVIDSRFLGFKYFSLPDVVADNCSAGLYIWGQELKDFRHLSLDKLHMSLLINGQAVQEANSAEISGHPVYSLMELAEMLSEWNEIVPAGAIVLAGASTPAVALEPGQKVELKISNLESLKIDVAL